MGYSYPFSYDWSTQEIIDVIKFFTAVETAYERGMKREELMEIYRRFKEIVPSKSEENRLYAEFEKESGYSSYAVIKQMKEAKNGDWIHIGPSGRNAVGKRTN
ncbi:UPF0223 family protein [Geobacillus stearothermophilus]|uniref:UPF0223 family protein n=1 Tax=Geobacillus TaxID=129337 RepID=UPI0006495767|nr:MULTISPECIES: UPF0223 family protein [Geobacillus]AKM18380.1 hypothetical protein GARCT_01086 [Geobacillus sp. 12AMOR1]AKU27579.1 hypothetical protein IB49_15610 [Geobacillus sp. LC300]ASS88323.1 hypothetical protein GLN3_15680 [Geobacillus lituanicus]MED4877193.1 UPF0223 family protein [Anoxybacillus geothermalis]ATA59386.1 hypothetical protein GS458_0930 [Geobacillus stearothermophilus]